MFVQVHFFRWTVCCPHWTSLDITMMDRVLESNISTLDWRESTEEEKVKQSKLSLKMQNHNHNPQNWFLFLGSSILKISFKFFPTIFTSQNCKPGFWLVSSHICVICICRVHFTTSPTFEYYYYGFINYHEITVIHLYDGLQFTII